MIKLGLIIAKIMTVFTCPSIYKEETENEIKDIFQKAIKPK